MFRLMTAVVMILVGPASLTCYGQQSCDKGKTPACKHNKQAAVSAEKTVGKSDAPSKADVLVKVETTLGEFVLKLDTENTPLTAANFVAYVKSGFYEGTIFHRVHRVEKEKRILGGTLMPDMKRKDKELLPPVKSEWDAERKNLRGTVALARMGRNRDSGQAGFFINLTDNPEYDEPRWHQAGFTVFGKVVKGMDVLDNILNTDLKVDDVFKTNKPVLPVEPVVIKSMSLLQPSMAPCEKAATPPSDDNKAQGGCPHSGKKTCPHSGKKTCPNSGAKPAKPTKPGSGD